MVWNGQYNPYTEFSHFRKLYGTIFENLKRNNTTENEIQLALAYVLAQNIKRTSRYFPDEVNCIELAMDTVLFYAHMDY